VFENRGILAFDVMNKKALSDMLVAVIMIVLAFSAFSILYLSVKKTIEPMQSPSTCFEKNLNPPATMESACYNSQQGYLKVTMKKNNLQEISSMDFTITSETNSSEFSCGNGKACACRILESGIKDYYFVTSSPKIISISIDGCAIETRETKEC
jgi:hypothetical protein